MPNVYSQVGGLTPSLNFFDLSYEKLFDCGFGKLIPVVCDEAIPADVWKISQAWQIRLQPMLAPIFTQIDVYFHYFFVPYRLLMSFDSETGVNLWTEFITGGSDGPQFNSSGEETYPDIDLPRYDSGVTGYSTSKYSFWDYLGFPVGITPGYIAPLAFPWRAYNLIWNEYYRDENVMDPVDITADNGVLYRCWKKDYFTSALPWQQRGTAPALPITVTAATDDILPLRYYIKNGDTITDGLISVVGFDYTQDTYSSSNLDFSHNHLSDPTGVYFNGDYAYARQLDGRWEDSQEPPEPQGSLIHGTLKGYNDWEDGHNDSEGAGIHVKDLFVNSFNISDLRLSFQIQKWLERNARSGYRYNEFLKAHFGLAPNDDTLQRPEYIGGCKGSVIVSEVLQTGESGNTPQGNMAGHGISQNSCKIGNYRVKEFGVIIGLMSIMPKASYTQGINRQWLRRDRYDFYFPEFANLSEQAIYTEELYCDGNEFNEKSIFGYQGAYNEMRTKDSMVCGDMRDEQKYYSLFRLFENKPELNQSFLEASDVRLDAFASVDENLKPPFICNIGNVLHVYRPMPLVPEPGLIDHH